MLWAHSLNLKWGKGLTSEICALGQCPPCPSSLSSLPRKLFLCSARWVQQPQCSLLRAKGCSSALISPDCSCCCPFLSPPTASGGKSGSVRTYLFLVLPQENMERDRREGWSSSTSGAECGEVGHATDSHCHKGWIQQWEKQWHQQRGWQRVQGGLQTPQFKDKGTHRRGTHWGCALKGMIGACRQRGTSDCPP